MLKKKDLKILSELRKNAREPLTEMSKKTSIPVSTIYTKLMAYRDSLIKKHTALLNYEELGYHTIAILFVSCEPEDVDKLKNSLVKSACVNSVFKLDDEYQFMAEAIFRHIKDADLFLEQLEQRFRIRQRRVFYIVRELKRESFLCDLELYELSS